MKGFSLGMLAVLLATSLFVLFGQSARADGLAIYERRCESAWCPDETVLIGRGYMEYDEAYVKGLVETWAADNAYCESVEWEPEFCSTVESWLEIDLPITDARLRLLGYTFSTPDFSATWFYDYTYGDARYGHELSVRSEGNYVYKLGGDDIATFGFRVNGIYGGYDWGDDDNEYFDEIDWTEGQSPEGFSRGFSLDEAYVSGIYPVGFGGEGATWDGKFLWIADPSAQQFKKFSASSSGLTLVSSIPYPYVGALPVGLAFDGAFLWTDLNGNLAQIDPTSGHVVKQIAGGGTLGGITFEDAFLWKVVRPNLRLIDPTNEVILDEITGLSSIPPIKEGLAWDGISLLLTAYSNSGNPAIYKIDPLTRGTVAPSFVLPSGTYNGLTFDGRDLWVVGYSSQTVYRISSGSPPPRPTVDPIAGDSCINEIESKSSLLVSGTAVPSATVTVSLGAFNGSTTADEDGLWSVLVNGIAAMPDGELDFRAYQEAPPGNVSPSKTLKVTKDTVPPGQSSQPDLDKWWDTGDSNTDDLTRLNRLRFRGTANEPKLTVLVQVDGETKGKGTTTDNGSWKANTTSLSEGVHSVRALTQDKCGNTGLVSAALSVEVDRTRPALTLEKKIAGDNLINAQETEAGITVSGTAEDGALVALTVTSGSLVISKETTASGAWAIQLSPAELGSLPDGKIKFKARAWDVAGNFRTASRTVTKDTVIAKPSVDPITGDDVITPEERQATIYVTGLSEPGGKVTFVLEGFTKTVGVKSTGVWSVPIAKSISASLPIGVLTAKVSAIDKAGNLSATTSHTVRNQ